MVVSKRNKVGKYRAHTTHGGGHRKKRRGAGSRGGRGNAGTGKRAGQKKAGISRKLGKKGFTSKRANDENGINVSWFSVKMVNKLLEKGKITKEGDVFVLNLNKLGYQKLLGTGTTNLKLRITVNNCSASRSGDCLPCFISCFLSLN